MEGAADRYGNPYVLSGEPVRSAVFVPLVAGRKATGVVSLQNVDREHAYSETDLRLLLTLCGSLSVALDNARLVHETRQRNAELALINSVQDSIAGELDQQAIYDLVGEKLREVFDAQVVDIAVHDEDAGLMRFVYQIERGAQLPERDDAGDRLPQARAGDARAARDAEDMDAALVEVRQPRVGRRRDLERLGDLPAARRRRPVDRRHLDPEPRPRARVQPVRPAAPCRPSPAASASHSRTPS